MGNISLEQLFGRTDKKMQARGWTRLVGVHENNQTVLVYVADGMDTSGRMDLCVAVVEGDKLVIVSTNVDADALSKLAEMKMPPGGFRGKLRLAKF
jgi:hypothetical protein